MILRDAKFSDLEPLIPIMQAAHRNSVFKDAPMNVAIIQRNFVTAMEFHNGFAKVIEHHGKVIGGMVGVIFENHYGIQMAQDLFTYSKGGTDMLIKAFKHWAIARGAPFTQVTDLSDNGRYQKLITDLGMAPSGSNYIGVA